MTKALLFLRIAAISTGIMAATIAICVLGYWWFSRPKSWNEKAIVAKFHDVEVDDQSDPGSLTFRYVLMNQTSEDYLLPSPQTSNLMKQNPKDQALDPLTEAVWPSGTIIPAKQSVIIAFKMPCGDIFDRVEDPTIVSCFLNDPYAEYGGFEEMPQRTSKSAASPRDSSGLPPGWTLEGRSARASQPSNPYAAYGGIMDGTDPQGRTGTVFDDLPDKAVDTAPAANTSNAAARRTGATPQATASAHDEWDQYAVPANRTNPSSSSTRGTLPPLPSGVVSVAPAPLPVPGTGGDPFAKYGGAAVEAPPVPNTQPPAPQKQDYEQTKEEVINATIGGLVFFDYRHRYEIVFPNDWKHSPPSR